MGTGLVKQRSFFTPWPPGSGVEGRDRRVVPLEGIFAAEQAEGISAAQQAEGIKTGGFGCTTDRPGKAIVAECSRRTEYLLVIYPHGEVQDKLLGEQQRFSGDYGIPMLVRNKPHITVAAFQAGEAMESILIRWIQRICGRYRSFDLTLNNYSGFPPHTIYLRIQDHQPFRQLAQQLAAIDDFIRSSGCPPVNLIGRPYLSIAGSLTEKIYSKAMPDYSRRTFHESFRVNELVLLKREHAFDACTTVNVFHLLPDLHEPCC